MAFVAVLALSWPLKNDREVIWQNYSFTLLLLAILPCDSCPEPFYLALSLWYKILRWILLTETSSRNSCRRLSHESCSSAPPDSI